MPAKKSKSNRGRIKSHDLDDDDFDFLNDVSMGNLARAKAALEVDDQEATRLLSVSDRKDRTVLEIATENEHFDIVKFFIQEHDGHLKHHFVNESLMLAITKGYLNITEVLLEFSGFSDSSCRARQTLGRRENFYDRNYHSKFDRDVTPIMMAATCNEVDILRLLIERGDKISKPHHPLCNCTNCLNRKEFDPLMHSLSIINAYRALSSEAYISLTSQDPILTAFLLTKELFQLSYTEKEFKNEYRELEDRCKKYASDLLDMCQNTSEVKTILKQEALTENDIGRQSNPGIAIEDDPEQDLKLPRLELAIKYKQKQFVAHPHCQHHLSTLWYRGIPGLREMEKWKRAVVLPLFLPVFPFAVLAYLVYPIGKFGAFMRSPIVKFLTQSGMYMVFLLLMFLESVMNQMFKALTPDSDTFIKDHKNCSALVDPLDVPDIKTSNIRPQYPTYIEAVLVVFITGMAWQEIKQIWREGFKTYLRSMWNWVDVAMLNLLIAAIILIYDTAGKVMVARAYFDKPGSCEKLMENNKVAVDHLYFLIGDRKQWMNDDPILVAEALFAMANVLSFSRLSFILPVSEFLGPLQISLGRMMGDIARFGAVFGVVYLAFFCAMCNLYWYYPNDSAFGTMPQAFTTLMWALFGLGDTSDTQCPESSPDCGHYLTEAFGTVLYGVYHAVMVVVMLNMLIAMMSTSYDEINNDEDVEWKYARSKLWMSYFEEGGTLPVPFNVIPSPKSIWYAVRWLRSKMCHRSNQRVRNRRTLSDSKQIALRNAVRRPATSHDDLMKKVVKRYLFQLQRAKDTDEVDEGELDEIKNDISSFRFDVLDLLRNLSSRMDVQEAANKSRDRPKDGAASTNDDKAGSDDVSKRINDLSTQLNTFRGEFLQVMTSKGKK